MAQVETVTGPIEAEQLGTTLIHEHLANADEAVRFQWPNAPTAREKEPRGIGYDQIEEVAIEEAQAAVDLGVKTIGEPSAMFLGRDVNMMRRVSEATGLQVVPCTGIYTYDYLQPFFQNRDADQIADLFVSDIEEGIQGTEIKSAFIKCAADEPGVTENIEKIHRAAARASMRTDTPIMAHTRPASNTGPRQIEIFEEEGVNPSKVQLAHTGDTDDLGYIEGVLEKGVWIGLDRYGLDIFLPYEKRQATAKALLERGFADRMFLSADSCATLDWFPPETIDQLIESGMANDWTIRIVPEKVLPELRESGMSEEQERTMMVDNAVRWLTS